MRSKHFYDLQIHAKGPKDFISVAINKMKLCFHIFAQIIQ